MDGEYAEAPHVIAGFRYQLIQSVIALLGLQPGERLLLEVCEDFSVESVDVSTDVQVKNSQAVAGPKAFSLQSPEVRAVLSRFWQASVTDGRERRLIFMARGGAAVERSFSFPGGVSGLAYWKVAALDADTTPLRAALQGLFQDEPLGRWLASNPSDDELRRRFLRRVSWQLDEHPADVLVLQTRDQVSNIYFSKGLPVTAADQAVNSLIALAFERASHPSADHRILEAIDLQRVLDQAAGVSLLAQAIAGSPPALAEAPQAFLISELEDFPSGLATRQTTVAGLLENARGQASIQSLSCFWL